MGAIMMGLLGSVYIIGNAFIPDYKKRYGQVKAKPPKGLRKNPRVQRVGRRSYIMR